MAGVRVIEVAASVAAPAAGLILADWSADVIKVEPFDGDPARGMVTLGPLGINPAFEFDNRGKRSIALDIGTPVGLTLLLELVTEADVFITNLRPSSLESLSIDPDTMLARFPALVYANVTGFGHSSPHRDRPSYDMGGFWARSGGTSRSEPSPTGCIARSLDSRPSNSATGVCSSPPAPVQASPGRRRRWTAVTDTSRCAGRSSPTNSSSMSNCQTASPASSTSPATTPWNSQPEHIASRKTRTDEPTPILSSQEGSPESRPEATTEGLIERYPALAAVVVETVEIARPHGFVEARVHGYSDVSSPSGLVWVPAAAIASDSQCASYAASRSSDGAWK
jgi:hypothetical protein